ncbi:DUF4199 domain-containing protein [Mucilaginibacter aquariorum]|uniref:DUF4199 domain-containing protein n=1 Tax=Mucilaginibacter aquariorum TaxID=2967225 RepID=A0ABT1SWJ3_9SPHI|nr:DUF4199 domain-containing protein [Mucilaginibacter aquariorum]MCQ6956725.1 DUF4199 domain-containing protein [Mucilaginibacter aquariorum]
MRNGLLIGGISIVLTLIFWIVDPLMQYTNTWVSLLMFVIIIALFVIFGLEIRKAVGGYWTFGEAFKGLFVMSLYVSILSIAFHYILFNFIDPTLAQRAADAVIAKLNDSLSKSGVSQEKIDEISKSITGKFDASFKNEAINLGVGIIIYAVIDLIIAAIIKKTPPLAPIIDDTDPTV